MLISRPASPGAFPCWAEFDTSLTTYITESGLELAQVVEFVGKPWRKLYHGRFATFYNKFLGKGIDDKPESNQSSDSDASVIVLENADDDTDTDNDTHMDDDMNTDTGMDTDGTDTDGANTANVKTDDELMSEYLDMSPIPVSVQKQIWIRPGHLRIYEYADTNYDRCFEYGDVVPLVIIGQPGIGASCVLSGHPFYRL